MTARQERGSILPAVVFGLLIVVLMGITGVTMLGNQTKIALDVQSTMEAHGGALGASEFVLRQLQSQTIGGTSVPDPDWSTPPPLQDSDLAHWPFQVTWMEAKRNTIRPKIESRVRYGDITARKEYRFLVWRLPRAFYYALFNGGDKNLQIMESSLQGNIYTREDLRLRNTAMQEGKIYHDENASVDTGGVQVTLKPVEDPQPWMPEYDTDAAHNSYEARVIQYHTDIQTAETNPVFSVTDGIYNEAGSPYTLSGTIFHRDVFFEGNVTVTGNGRIVAWRNVGFQPFTPGACKELDVENDSGFITREGGCKDMTSGLIWSARKVNSVEPYEDDTHPAADNFCTNLVEGGFDDWTLPTEEELTGAEDRNARNFFNFETNAFFWSSTPDGTLFVTVNLDQGNTRSEDPSEIRAVVCVRSSTGGSKLLTITPDGGDIEIVAGHNLFKYDDPKRILEIQKEEDPGTGQVVLHAKSDTHQDHLLFLSGNTTSAERVLMMGTRRLVVSGGADITSDSVLYVRSLAGSSQKNFLRVRGTGKEDQTTVDGSLLSVGQNDRNLRITDGARITGLVFSNALDGNKELEIENSVIRGSVVAEAFKSDRIRRSSIDNTDIGFYPISNIPDGFTESASMVPESWDGS